MNPDLFDPEETINDLYAKNRIISDALELMISYLAHQDQDADHAWMARKMREALGGKSVHQDTLDMISDLEDPLVRPSIIKHPELYRFNPDPSPRTINPEPGVGHFEYVGHTTQESNDARGYGNLDSCDCSAGRRIKNLPHDSKCPMFDRK